MKVIVRINEKYYITEFTAAEQVTDKKVIFRTSNSMADVEVTGVSPFWVMTHLKEHDTVWLAEAEYSSRLIGKGLLAFGTRM
ncbi:MAG: hypothetical protein ILO53_01475 [Clostridia bacterium]|nr:hypothetical protein [Clostridia bacterium]